MRKVLVLEYPTVVALEKLSSSANFKTHSFFNQNWYYWPKYVNQNHFWEKNWKKNEETFDFPETLLPINWYNGGSEYSQYHVLNRLGG